MATRNEYFKGKAKYAFVSRLNNYGHWSVNLYLDNASKDKIIELQTQGLKNTLKKDEDGYYVKFKRDPKKTVEDRKTGATRELTFAPPLVFDIDGKVMDNVSIGNGSDISVNCQVYNFGGVAGIAKGVAARLESVRVDNLVPYTKDDLNTMDERQSRGLNEQPEHEF